MNTRHPVLIVDDEPIQRNLLAEMLKNDYEVIIAKNGEQALERINVNPHIDLIMMDIMMPKMDGYETCSRLKDNFETATIPVIFLSAMSETVDKVTAFSLGGVDYITKPFQKEEVMARVKTHLALRTAQKQLQKKNADLAHEVEQRKKAEAEQQRLIEELKRALAEVKQLSGLLPICSFCKKIRDDQDYWHQVDQYFGTRSNAQFTHSICPDCLKKHYPEMNFDKE